MTSVFFFAAMNEMTIIIEFRTVKRYYNSV